MRMFDDTHLPDSDITSENCGDPFAFEPVPCRRRNGWTAEKQRVFIEALSKIGTVSAAAEAAGMSRKSAYALRERDGAESFADVWDFALGVGQDHVRGLAIDRALNGYTVPRYYRGRICGERRIYDNRLLERAINSFDRQTYIMHHRNAKNKP